MSSQTKRERLRQSRRRARMRDYGLWIGIGGIVVLVIAALLWPSIKTEAGEAVPVMASAEHVQEGEDLGPYNTDPPTSGQHYASDLDVGFYDASDMEDIGLYPEGYLAHNLEHGYIIFWYNCDLFDDAGCATLKDQIRGVMEDSENYKVITFPWSSIEAPVVMTSWRRMQMFETFDPDLARSFVIENRNKAPEPHAP
jgi:hypothetical protein